MGANNSPPTKPIIGLCGLLFSILCPTVIGWVIIELFADWSFIKTLKKPEWFPPREIFYPLFSASYILIGAASYLIWKVGKGFCGSILPQLFNVIQLLASYAWFVLLFNEKSLDLALAASSVQWVAALVTSILFGVTQKKTLLLTLPYLIWHGVIVALNIHIYVLEHI